MIISASLLAKANQKKRMLNHYLILFITRKLVDLAKDPRNELTFQS